MLWRRRFKLIYSCLRDTRENRRFADRRVDGHQAEPHLHLDLLNVTLMIEDFDFMRAADRLTFDLLGDRRASGAGHAIDAGADQKVGPRFLGRADSS